LEGVGEAWAWLFGTNKRCHCERNSIKINHIISRGNLPHCISDLPNAALLNTKDKMEDCRSLCSVYISIEKASQ